MNQKVTAFQFDATQVAPQTAFEALPGGTYPVIIVDGEVTLTEGGAGQRVNLEFQVCEGPNKNRRAFDGFNTRHSNADTQRIAQAQMSSICHAVKVYQVADISALFNKPFLATFSVEPKRTVNSDNKDKDANGVAYVEGAAGTKTYEAKNRFKVAKEYTPGAAVPGATPAPAAGGVPAWAVAGTATPPPASVTPPPAIVTPPPATGGKPATKPAGGKPATKPGKPKAERKFFVGIDSPEFAELVPESKLVEYLTKGLPADTGILSEEDSLAGVTDYKTAAAYQVGASAPVATATPAPVVPPPVTPPPAAAGGTVPPWLR